MSKQKNDPHIASQHRKHAQAQQRVARTYPGRRRPAVSCLFEALALLIIALFATNGDLKRRAEARRKIDPIYKGVKKNPPTASKGCLSVFLFLTWLLLA